MDKNILLEVCDKAKNNTYTWELYFFKVDRRSNNPYSVYKIRFKSNVYLIQYTKSLAEMVKKYQLGKIEEIKEYTGENTKISCDVINTDHELLKEQWDFFVQDVAASSDEKVEGKFQGYVLEGISTSEEEKNIIFLKFANPIINLKNKRSMVFSFDENSELAELSDDVCKLYMDVDAIVTDENLFSFNYKFEDIFNIEKTMQKVKNRSLDEIVAIDAFEDKDQFEQMARSYKSPRTFLTLKQDRINRIKQKTKRKKVAEMLGIDLDVNGKFSFKNEEEVSLLIRYLCFKVFKDAETQELLEANNVTQIQI